MAVDNSRQIHSRYGRRALRCRPQGSRIGKTVEALEQAFGDRAEVENQPQSNIIYYFIELRRPQNQPDTNNAHADAPSWHLRLDH